MIFRWAGRMLAVCFALSALWLCVSLALGQYGRAVVLFFAIYGFGSAAANAFMLAPPRQKRGSADVD